jgi:aspartyl/asparaginyl-tRNA synthetase
MSPAHMEILNLWLRLHFLTCTSPELISVFQYYAEVTSIVLYFTGTHFSSQSFVEVTTLILRIAVSETYHDIFNSL